MKPFLSVWAILILLYFFSCSKNTDDLTANENLLIAKPWILHYTDSVFIDSNQVVHTDRIQAAACALQESLTFLSSHIYQQKKVCNLAAPEILTGQWDLSHDTLLTYGLVFDSLTLLNPSTIIKMNADSLQIIQFHSLDTSSHHPIYVTDAYTH